MDVSIRRARGGDRIPLFALISEHAEFEQSKATINDAELARILEMRQSPVRIFIAAVAQETLAYAALTTDYSLWRGHKWAHLDCLFVKQEARGLGIGAKLLHHIKRVSRRSALDRLEWQTPDWNQKAIAFYHREGAISASKMRFCIEISTIYE
jgi:GNAT superfamily N-acetyltransferase